MSDAAITRKHYKLTLDQITNKTFELTVDFRTDTNTPSALSILLCHGAGGGMDSGNLPRFATEMAQSFPINNNTTSTTAATIIRFTHRTTSLTNRTLVAKALLQQVVTEIPECAHITQWIVAGHSMGARVACELAAATQLPPTDKNYLNTKILGCILFSYPLHPPGKPKQLRDTPLCDITLPMLFIRGTRDPFSIDKKWEAVMKRIKSEQVKVHIVDGGDHGLVVSGGKDSTEGAFQGVCTVVRGFIHGVVRDSDMRSTSSSSIDRKGFKKRRRREKDDGGKTKATRVKRS